MKKIAIIFALTFNFFLVNAQKERLNQLFDKYQETEGVTSIKIAKPMFGMLSKLDIQDSELDQIKPLLSKIQGLKILIVDKPTESSDKPASFYDSLGKEILSSVNNLNYQELVTVNSKDSKIKFLSSDATDGMLDNLLLNINSQGSTVLMMLDGKLSMEDVDKLVSEVQTSSALEDKQPASTKSSTSSNLEQVRNVEAFTGIHTSTGIKVNFTQGTPQSIVVDVDSDKLQYVKTEVSKSGILRIYVDNNGKRNLRFKKLVVNVQGPHLKSIETTSGSTFTAQNTVKEDNVSISATSGSSLNADFVLTRNATVSTNSGSNARISLKASNLSLKATSGSSITIVGNAPKANFEISSAASVNAENLKTFSTVASASSGASLKVEVQNDLTSNVSSGASVRYTGKPQTMNTKTSSGGSTKPIN